MGQLEKGRWIVSDVIPESDSGEFRREQQKLRDSIEVGGKFPAVENRYHLYVSYACPWAHRTLIMLKLKDLEQIISVSVVSPDMMDDGWTFHRSFPGVVPDDVLHKKFLHEVYTTAVPDFSGKVTVPVLFDKKSCKIVNNESSEIIRILNSSFNEITDNQDDFYPQNLRSEIDAINEDVYEHINNGVYKAGFAKNQKYYDEAVALLFSALERVERRLDESDFLVGDMLTEADIRLFTTLVRFDCVYYGHFKCNLRMIRQFQNLPRYLSRLYRLPAFRDTTHFDHIKRHYYYSHRSLNPTQIVPAGPDQMVLEFSEIK